MSGRNFIPDLGERALIVGQTGSGKTAFACWLMVRIPITPIIIYDTKEEPKFTKLPNHVVVETAEEVRKEYSNVKVDYIICRPPTELLGSPELLDEFLWQHYLYLRHSVAYIDEGTTFHTTGGRPFKGLIALMTRGRSRGITTIISSQRPVNLSRTAITEAQKVYAFRLADGRDRKTLSEVIPNFDLLPVAKNHYFYYFESGNDDAELFRPVKLDRELDTGYTDIPPETSIEELNQEVTAAKSHVWV